MTDMLISRLYGNREFEMSCVSCLRCTSTVKKNVTNDIVIEGRPMKSEAKRNDVAKPLAGCISRSNRPIMIPFVANCSCLLDSRKVIKLINEHGSIFRRYRSLDKTGGGTPNFL